MTWLNELAGLILALVVALWLITWLRTGSPTTWFMSKFSVAKAA